METETTTKPKKYRVITIDPLSHVRIAYYEDVALVIMEQGLRLQRVGITGSRINNCLAFYPFTFSVEIFEILNED